MRLQVDEVDLVGTALVDDVSQVVSISRERQLLHVGKHPAGDLGLLRREEVHEVQLGVVAVAV